MQREFASSLEKTAGDAYQSLVSAGVQIYGINGINQIVIAKEQYVEHYYIAPYKGGAFLFPNDYLRIIDGPSINKADDLVSGRFEYFLLNGQSFTVYTGICPHADIRNLLSDERVILEILPYEPNQRLVPEPDKGPNYLTFAALILVAAAAGFGLALSQPKNTVKNEL